MSNQRSQQDGQHQSPRRHMFGGRRGGPAVGMAFEKPRDFSGTFKRLIQHMRPHYLMISLVFVLATFSTLFNVISPRIMGNATTILFDGFMERMEGIPGGGVDFAAIGRLALILIGLYVLSSAFQYSVQYIMAGVAQRIAYDLRQRVNTKLARLPLSFYDGRAHGDVLSRVTNDVDNISNTLQQSITEAISSLVTMVGVLIMMLTMNIWLTLITLITLPMATLVTTQIAKRSQRYFKSQQKALGELNGHVEEMFTGHAVVKAFSREGESLHRFSSINDDLFEAGWRAQFASGLIMPAMQFINNLGYLMVSVAGAIFVTQGMIRVGDIQAFVQYSRRFSQPIVQLASIANIIQSTIASAERVFELLDEEEMTPEAENGKQLEKVKGHVQFQDVYFGYTPDRPLYEGLNLDVKPGQVIAIVGPTGAGKTTLVNLLMRFYEIDSGRILVDGTDLRDMTRSELRSHFGMVLQDTWLFNGTIRDNIAYGRKDATDEDIVAAARAAYADHFIRTLPDGYDTVLNEEASNLSQGQKQLLTIARAILADPSILILDEATSSVDTRTEIQLQQAMEQLMQGRTSFVIAHRLSTIRDADNILVMNEGRIIEQGHHEELLEANGFYADLYNSQFVGSAAKSVS